MLSHSVPLTCDLCQQAIAEGASFYRIDHCYQYRHHDGGFSVPRALYNHAVCTSCVIVRLTWAIHSPTPTLEQQELHSVSLQRCLVLSEQCIHPMPFELSTYHYQPFLKESVCDTSLYAAPSSAPA